jgi:hypothetical protein
MNVLGTMERVADFVAGCPKTIHMSPALPKIYLAFLTLKEVA